MPIIAGKPLICIYHAVQHNNIAIFMSALQGFGSAFSKPYYIWMFTQAWRYSTQSWYFPQQMQKTSSCNMKNSNLYIENKYHYLTSQKNPITFEQRCIIQMIKWCICTYSPNGVLWGFDYGWLDNNMPILTFVMCLIPTTKYPNYPHVQR